MCGATQINLPSLTLPSVSRFFTAHQRELAESCGSGRQEGGIMADSLAHILVTVSSLYVQRVFQTFSH